MENKLYKTTKNKFEWKLEDIPIIIDSVKTYEDFHMSRCNYFTISSDEPQANWQMILQNSNIPFYLIHLQGILYCSIDGSPFSDSEDIETLFNLIDDQYNLSIDVNDIWIPNFLFNSSDINSNVTGKPRRRDVYRIPQGLFREAYKFRENFISKATYEEICRIFLGAINYSPTETYAFRKYEDKLINQLIQNYPKSFKYELKWESKKEGK